MDNQREKEMNNKLNNESEDKTNNNKSNLLNDIKSKASKRDNKATSTYYKENYKANNDKSLNKSNLNITKTKQSNNSIFNNIDNTNNNNRQETGDKHFFISIIPKEKEEKSKKLNYIKLSNNNLGKLSKNFKNLDFISNSNSIVNNNNASCSISNINNIFNYSKINKPSSEIKFNNIFESVKDDLKEKIKKENNVSFFSIGDSVKDNFFYGSTNYFVHNSFFITSFNYIIDILKQEDKFDIILIDYMKIHKEKFLLDYRNMQFNFQVEIIEYLNYITSTEVDINANCTTVLIFKFFKYTNDKDLSKTEREVSLSQTITYINLDSYEFKSNNCYINNSSLIKDNKANSSNYLKMNNIKYPKESTSNQNVNVTNSVSSKYELQGFEKFFNLNSAISRLDLDAFIECNCIDTPILCSILKQPLNSLYFFYFITEEIDKDYFNVIKQNINELKSANYEYFLEFGNYNFDAFNNDNFYSKQDFYLLERIFSEILQKFEKEDERHRKKLDKNKEQQNEPNITFNDQNDISILQNFKLAQSQIEKFDILKDIIEGKEDECYDNFKSNIKCVLDDVFEFFNNRTKWKKLQELVNYLNLITLESDSELIDNNESKDLHSVVNYLNDRYEVLNKNIHKEKNALFDSSLYQLNESNIFESDKYDINNAFSSNTKEKAKINKTDKLDNVNAHNNKGMSFGGTGTNLDMSTKLSVEYSFTQLVLRDYLKNLKRSVNSITKQMLSSKNELCFGTCASEKSTQQENFSFKPNVNYYQILKSNMHQIKSSNKYKSKNKNNKGSNEESPKSNNNNKNTNNDYRNNPIINSLSFSNEDPDFFCKMDNTIILNQNIKVNNSNNLFSLNPKNNRQVKYSDTVINNNFKKSHIKISKISLIQQSKHSKSIYKINLNNNNKNTTNTNYNYALNNKNSFSNKDSRTNIKNYNNKMNNSFKDNEIPNNKSYNSRTSINNCDIKYTKDNINKITNNYYGDRILNLVDSDIIEYNDNIVDINDIDEKTQKNQHTEKKFLYDNNISVKAVKIN